MAEFKNQSEVQAFLALLAVVFPGYAFDFDVQDCGWCRAFVQWNKEPDCKLSLGRLNFQPALDKTTGAYDVYGLKHYKPTEYLYDPMDAFFYQFDTWHKIGLVVEIDSLIPEAKKMAQEVAAAWEVTRKTRGKLKIDNRNGQQYMKYPKRKDPENWMPCFRKLVQEKIAEAEKVYKSMYPFINTTETPK